MPAPLDTPALPMPAVLSTAGIECCGPSELPQPEQKVIMDTERPFVDYSPTFLSQLARMQQQLDRLLERQDQFFNLQLRVEKSLVNRDNSFSSAVESKEPKRIDGRSCMSCCSSGSMDPDEQAVSSRQDLSPMKSYLDAIPVSMSFAEKEEKAMSFLSDSITATEAGMNLQGKRYSKATRARKEKALARTHKKKKRIRRILEVNDQIEKSSNSAAEAQAVRKHSGWRFWIASFDPYYLEMMVDSVMGIVICLNSVFIGLSMDRAGDGFDGWSLVDLMFTIFFLFEFGLKLAIHGASEYLCGPHKYSNIFDTCLIMADALQLLFQFVVGSGSDPVTKAGFPSASLFRIVRLCRISRLLKLFSSDTVKDLSSMIQGMTNGAVTLLWAVVVFLLFIYVFALICRESFGRKEHSDVETVYPYFSTVERSMLTVFRCSFGDCSTNGGVPIPEHIADNFSGWHALGYCLFSFSVTIGLFNIISAIFVESTMSASHMSEEAQRQERMDDESRWCGNVASIIKELMKVSPEYKALLNQTMLEDVDEIAQLEFSRAAIDVLVRHGQENRNKPNVLGPYLDALDIDYHDHRRLSDILDPDHSGTIGILELVEGLHRLRGEPRRSDVVTVDLMVRSMQEKVDILLDHIAEIKEYVNKDRKARKYYGV